MSGSMSVGMWLCVVSAFKSICMNNIEQAGKSCQSNRPIRILYGWQVIKNVQLGNRGNYVNPKPHFQN